MPRLGCLFCKRKQRLFKISMVYDTDGPIKNYIVDFLGPCEQFLQDDQGLCSACVFVLNKLLYLKKCMYLIVSSSNGDQCNNTPHFKFSYVYKYFLENLQTLTYEDYETDTDENIPELLRPIHSSPYEEEREAEYDHRYGTPHNDREVQSAFSRRGRQNRGRRKRRGHNWSRQKGSKSRSKSRLTTYSEPMPRTSRGRSTVMNFSEYYSSNSSENDEDNDQEVALSFENFDGHRNGILPNRQPSTTSTGTYRDDISVEIAPKYKCVAGCSFNFANLNDLTNHKVEDHGMLANYICYECYAAKFVSPEDLKLHNDQFHHTLITHCLLCSSEFRTTEELEKHLSEHQVHSYPCKYCSTSFLDRETCKKHIAECHKGKRKRIRRYTQCTIISRIHRSNKSSPIDTSQCDDKYKNQIIRRLQDHQSVQTLKNLCIAVLMGSYQGTLDISDLIRSSYGNNPVTEGSNTTVENQLEAEKDQNMETNDGILNRIEEDLPSPIETEMMEISESIEITTVSIEDQTNQQSVILNGMYSSSNIEQVVAESNKIDSNTAGSSGAGNSNVSNESTNNSYLTTLDHFERFVRTNNVKSKGVSVDNRDVNNSRPQSRPPISNIGLINSESENS